MMWWVSGVFLIRYTQLRLDRREKPADRWNVAQREEERRAQCHLLVQCRHTSTCTVCLFFIPYIHIYMYIYTRYFLHKFTFLVLHQHPQHTIISQHPSNFSFFFLSVWNALLPVHVFMKLCNRYWSRNYISQHRCLSEKTRKSGWTRRPKPQPPECLLLSVNLLRTRSALTCTVQSLKQRIYEQQRARFLNPRSFVFLPPTHPFKITGQVCYREQEERYSSIKKETFLIEFCQVVQLSLLDI